MSRARHQQTAARAPGGRALLLLGMLAVIQSGCAAPKEQAGARASAPSNIVEQIRAVDLRARYPRGLETDQASVALEGPEPVSFYGNAGPAVIGGQDRRQNQQSGLNRDDALTTGALPARADVNGGRNQGFEMNFENTPVATVAKAILGDILGVGYTIDPRVQGSVSLSSGRPVAKKDLLYVLESALRANNIALVREASGYRLVPAAEAPGTGSLDTAENPEPGYGITVVPLQYVSAQTLAKVLESFATKPGTVRTDPTRNLVIIQGNASDRRATIDAVLSFDADWMRGQSVGIYPVSNSAPEPVIAELDKIIDTGEGGLSQNLVKLQPISRQNAVLVVTRRPDLLKTVATWITRLDKAGIAGTGVKVYRMRYGDAKQVAALLSDMFGGGSGSGLDSPANQLTPNGGALAVRNDRLGAGGSQLAGGTAGAPVASPGLSAGADTRLADAGGGRLNSGAALQRAGYGRDVPYGGGGSGVGGGAPLLPGVRITADVVNNAVLVYANQENYRVIERTLQQLDRPQLQVAIDATIAEITLNDKLSYGVQFFLKSQNVGLKPNTGSVINTATGTSTALSRILPGFNFLVGSEADPRVILDALHSVTDVKVLSTPSLVVVDNQYASLQVGDQIPITTRTAQSVDVPTAPIVNSVDYRNTGVILRVAPRINANGNVMLDIEQEISSVAQTSTAETLTPTVSQRKVRSSIVVASGQTVLLGGLMSERQDRGSDGIPLLDQAPGVLSALFSRKTGALQRTELVIFIRPQIIRNGMDARRVAEELRLRMREMYGPVAAPPPPPPPLVKASESKPVRRAAATETK